ncbi:MAG: chemotaxis protein CheW [Desulfovibrionaceae bacterium]
MEVEDIEMEEEVLQVVCFNIGKEEYALNILNVREIIRMNAIASTPLTPEHVVGVMNLRGNIIPVINLHICFEVEEKEKTEQTRIIVTEYDNSIVAFIVDTVSEVLYLNKKILEETTDMTMLNKDTLIENIAKLDDGKRIVLLLNILRLVNVNTNGIDEN